MTSYQSRPGRLRCNQGNCTLTAVSEVTASIIDGALRRKLGFRFSFALSRLSEHINMNVLMQKPKSAICLGGTTALILVLARPAQPIVFALS